ncbi:terminase gpA endonuclease subunit [Pseudomonas juntendi]|uniref:terminase gpA endonuclease subunit n=1 Tax=Pseudomonas juntendi TaxID=2666183 RepID=UPI00244B48DF|nr:terminase gpA endonuclease subunit [Pseudomonas juntendi]MDH1551008.1 phage terminase large subunit family protein [Pseudomonas juntendi]
MIKSISLAAKMVQAPPPRTADEWARDKRIMPPSSPIPGPFNPDTNPYMRPVAWAFAQPCFSRVVFVMGTQMGKSVTMENIIGHRLDEDPTPCLYVAPTKPLIDSTVEPKFMAMFQECKSLWTKFSAASTKMVKWIGGTKFRFAWAGSPTELAADSAGLVMVDEVDRIVNTGEGDTTEVIEARGDAYPDSKIGYTATPTHGKVGRRKNERTGLWHWEVVETKKVASKIWQLWQSGTRHEWAVPCPSCSAYFIPCSELLWWPGKGGQDECTPDEAFHHARLSCPGCGDQLEDKWRPWMNARGVAVPPGCSVTKDGQIEGTAETEGFTTYSIWISGLCSFAVKKSYGFLAKKLLAAQVSGDPAKLLAVYNTGFGEVYGEAGDVPTWEEIRAMCFGYKPGELLLEPERIYLTVDVQKGRLVYVVRAWFKGMGSMLLEHGELWGETDQDAVWGELSELLETSEYGDHGISMAGIDIGYRDDQVYAFINAHKGRAIALRGRETLPKPFRRELVEENKQGKTRKRGDARWAFNSTLAKRWVHSRFGRPDGRPGWWLLHAQVTDDYCKQLVGEEWHEADGKFHQVGENHYLDCEAMQYILALRDKLHKRNAGALTRAQLQRKAGPEGDQVGQQDDADPEQASAAPAPHEEPEVEAQPQPAPRARREDAPKAKARAGRFKVIRKSR